LRYSQLRCHSLVTLLKMASVKELEKWF